jgi:hypothetical protein
MQCRSQLLPAIDVCPSWRLLCGLAMEKPRHPVADKCNGELGHGRSAVLETVSGSRSLDCNPVRRHRRFD